MLLVSTQRKWHKLISNKQIIRFCTESGNLICIDVEPFHQVDILPVVVRTTLDMFNNRTYIYRLTIALSGPIESEVETWEYRPQGLCTGNTCMIYPLLICWWRRSHQRVNWPWPRASCRVTVGVPGYSAGICNLLVHSSITLIKETQSQVKKYRRRKATSW